MSNINIYGVKLADLGEPIRHALLTYSALTDGHVRFDADAAARLNRTPDKPNSARSQTVVTMGGKAIGDLYVIAFAPWDGTGDNTTYMMDHVRPYALPHVGRFVPRRKFCGLEGHFTLVSQRAVDNRAEPRLFAGRLGEFTLAGSAIVRAGNVGQPQEAFDNTMDGRATAEPTVTLTCGFRGMLQGWLDRDFGNPHALVNEQHRTVQVCGFLAVDTVNMQAFNDLGAVELCTN